MGDLAPIAFDIETSGLEPGSVITVAGLAFELGEVILLNTGDRAVDVAELEVRLSPVFTTADRNRWLWHTARSTS